MNRFCTIVLASALLSLGCGGKKPADPGPVPAGETPTGTSDSAKLVGEAGKAASAAEALASSGELESARLEYERSVEILLSLPHDIGGVEENQHVRVLLAESIAAIHDIEQAQRAAVSNESQDMLALGEEDAGIEARELAAADELASDPVLAELELENDALNETSESVSEAQFAFPIEYNARVESLVKMFKERKRDWFQESLDRSGRYLPMVKRTFRKHGLPEELAALAMVESAFKSRAVSRAGARGIWQFIRATGRMYGLQSDFWVDDRFDPEKATDAAARHLKDLHEQFGDWYLAMAAYNSGPRRVQRAIRQTGSRDFWTLAKRRRLPRETRSYVPLILATMVIAKDPVSHGFVPPVEQDLSYDLVTLDFPLDLQTAAEAAEVSLDDMKLLNPELRRWVTPMDARYDLKIPTGTKDVFCAAIDAIPPDERVRFGTHVVRRGDTLSKIAERYGSRIDDVATANNLSRRSLIHPGQVLTIPVLGSGKEIPRHTSTRSASRRTADGHVYTVRRGDSLARIASSFRISLSQLREMNGLSSRETTIHPGQRLVVASSSSVSHETKSAAAEPKAATGDARVPAAAGKTKTPPASNTGANGSYLVRTGDTLGQIAEAHGMRLSALRRMNDMRGRRSRIYPGQRLVVSGASKSAAGDQDAGETRYRVRRGDTLSKIAQRFGVSVDEIREWNDISRDRIVAGQSLTIYPGTDH